MERTAATDNEHFANNLILSSDGPGAIFSVSTYTSYSSSDYNGFRANAGSEHAFEWDSPPTGTTVLYGATQLANRQFKTLADYSRATGQDTHSVMVDYDTFVKASKPDTKDLQRLYSPEDFDFRLAPGSPAVDARMVLPTINDGFTGRAPDLGAYEVGRPLPHYGPRSMPPGTSSGDITIRSIAGPSAQSADAEGK